jgi:FkbM family methyltransferase
VSTVGDRLAGLVLRAAWVVANRLLASPRLMQWVRAVAPSGSGHDRWYHASVAGQTFHAPSLDRLLAVYFWKYGVLEAYELEVIGSILKPGMTVIDVGANIGFHTLHFARSVGPTGQVHAFEPEPANFEALTRNIAASGFRHVTPHRAAVAAGSGAAAMHVSAVHRGDHSLLPIESGRATITVETTSLDAMFLAAGRPVDFVKIDVQGAEVLVLDGMWGLFEAWPQMVVAIEFSPELMARSGQPVEPFFDRLAGLAGPAHRRAPADRSGPRPAGAPSAGATGAIPQPAAYPAGISTRRGV